jgi:UMF1 family MFS transporter
VSDLDVPKLDASSRAREQRGWIYYDWANSVFQTSVITVFLSLYLTGVAKADAEANGRRCETALVDCDVSFLGLQIPAGSVFPYLISIATVVQVLVLPIAGAIADRTQNKRRMLGWFAMIGSVATALLALVVGTNWQLAVWLFIVANVCYGASVVVYYAFLPEIAGPDERDRLSSRGWAFGYLGGGVALAIHLAIYLGRDKLGLTEAEAVRVCFLTAGIWWAAFTLIPLRTLQRHQAAQGNERGAAILIGGFRQLLRTLRDARNYPLTLAFLGAYLIFTDGISTVAQIAGLYGEQELHLSRDVLITTILIVQFVAFGGGHLHGALARRVGAKRTILVSLVIWVAVVTAAYFVQAGDQLQFYALALGIGLVLGGTNALARSLFSQMIPTGKEAEYYSLYELTERGTSWLGPLLFGAVAAATGSYRPAIISLIVFFVVGFILVALVPARRAIAAVGNPEPTLV